MPSRVTERNRTPALTPEAAERHCIDAAYALAQRQLDDGSASPSVITHFLKMGTEKARLEREKLESDILLNQSKNNAIQDSKKIEELYSGAIKAMREYSGKDEDGDGDGDASDDDDW